MRKNLNKPKTFADFEDLLEDETFSKLWYNDHAKVVATQCDVVDEGNEYEVCKDPSSIATCTATSSTKSTTPSSSTFDSTRKYVVLNQQTRENFGIGESLIEKLVIQVMVS